MVTKSGEIVEGDAPEVRIYESFMAEAVLQVIYVASPHLLTFGTHNYTTNTHNRFHELGCHFGTSICQ